MKNGGANQRVRKRAAARIMAARKPGKKRNGEIISEMWPKWRMAISKKWRIISLAMKANGGESQYVANGVSA